MYSLNHMNLVYDSLDKSDMLQYQFRNLIENLQYIQKFDRQRFFLLACVLLLELCNSTGQMHTLGLGWVVSGWPTRLDASSSCLPRLGSYCCCWDWVNPTLWPVVNQDFSFEGANLNMLFNFGGKLWIFIWFLKVEPWFLLDFFKHGGLMVQPHLRHSMIVPKSAPIYNPPPTGLSQSHCLIVPTIWLSLSILPLVVC